MPFKGIMIKLSRFADYAVVMLAEFAGERGLRLAASDLAARVKLPEPTVAKILKSLTKGGILKSSRGVNGGYSLTRDAAAITVADIITAIEGPISLTDCASDQSSCLLEGHCGLHGRWGKVNMAVRAALESVTLIDLIHSEKKPSPPRGEGWVRGPLQTYDHAAKSNFLSEGPPHPSPLPGGERESKGRVD